MTTVEPGYRICELCGERVEPPHRYGPHISVHVRQAKARYIYKPGDKHPREWRDCRVCGKRYLARANRGKGFCSVSCAQRRENNSIWVGVPTKTSTKYARANNWFSTPDACERCGTTERKIHRHHVDENPANNVPENIEFLCTKCHAGEHAARRRRRKGGE